MYSDQKFAAIVIAIVAFTVCFLCTLGTAYNLYQMTLYNKAGLVYNPVPGTDKGRWERPMDVPKLIR